LKIISLLIKDFISIGEVFISLPDSGMLLVDGWNHDSQSANGAGKSSILSAISWSLYGKLPREITSSSVTRSGAKACSVTCDFVVNKTKYSLTRQRPNSLKITVDDEEPRSIDQLELDAILGISYERYLMVSYFAQGLGTRFLDLSDTDKKSLFLELSKTANFNTAKASVEIKFKKLESQSKQLESSYLQLKSRAEEIKISIPDCESLNAQDAKDKVLINKLQQHISSIVLEAPDLSRHKELKQKLKKELEKVSEAKGELRSAHGQLKRLQIAAAPFEPIPCPNCGHHLLIESNELSSCDTASIRAAEARASEKRNVALLEIAEQIKELDKRVSKESRILEAIEKCEQAMTDLSSEYLNQKQDLADLMSRLQLAKQKNESTLLSISQAEKVLARLAVIEKDRDIAYSQFTSMQDELQLLDAVIHTLGASGIQAYVLDAVIDQFNENVRSTLSSAWPNLTYELLSFKENKTGTLSTRFSESIFMDSSPRSIGALSGGELRCLSIAIDIALIKTFQMYASFIPSPVILDEPFDHMDSSNRERAITILQSFSQDTLTIVVDHDCSTKGLYDQIIQVDKRNGLTSATIDKT
jgi:DNA repair exonuclease SbcCD ATPase subunit